MVLDSVNIFPHGTMILDITTPFMVENLPPHALQLNRACYELGNAIFANDAIDYIFLVTPHGIALKESIGLYSNSAYEGTAEWNRYWASYRLSCENDVALSKDLFRFLQSKQLPIDMITCFSQGVEGPLAWGEVVPLWFCQECCHSNGKSKPKVIISSLPVARHVDPIAFSEIALKYGEYLAEYATNSSHRIAVVISADLSHVHEIEGEVIDLFRSPDPSLSPDPDTAKQFDGLIVDWAKALFNKQETTNSSNILAQALAIAPDAKSCGIGGFCVAQGLFNYLSSQVEAKLDQSTFSFQWDGELYYYAAPTYYGMMVVGAKIKT